MLNLEQQKIHDRALSVATAFRKSETELIDVLQNVEAKRVFVALGFPSLFTYAVQSLQLSEANAQSLILIARKSRAVPELKQKIQSGEVSVSKASRIVSVITPENKNEWLQKAATNSKRELEREVVKANPGKAVYESFRPVAEDRIKLTLGVSDALMKKLERAKAILSNKKRSPQSFEATLEVSIDLFLEKHDPVEKAKRAEERNSCPGKSGNIVSVSKPIQQPMTACLVSGSALAPTPNHASTSKPVDSFAPGQISIPQSLRRPAIPASIRHEVFRRDQGKCTYRDSAGSPCGSTYFVDLHHRHPVSKGGQNKIENLVTLCKIHHRYHHESMHQRT